MSKNIKQQQQGLQSRERHALFAQMKAHRSRLRKALVERSDKGTLQAEIDAMLDKALDLDAVEFNDLNGNPSTQSEIDRLKPLIEAANAEAERLKKTKESLDKFTKSFTQIIDLGTKVINIIT